MTDRKTGNSPQEKQKSSGRLSKKSKEEPKVNNNNNYNYDQCYKFCEPKIAPSAEEMEYQPMYFLRAHSKNNDSADVQTQIWQCSFEPDTNDPLQHTDIFATCGGASVCFISIKTGEVVLKYNRNAKGTATENLIALVWSSLPLDDLGLKRMNILATSGGKATVILIHPEAGCCYQMFRTVMNKNNVVVCSLLFHPKKASWLFCGHDDGEIQLWDIGIPNPPDYDVTPVHLLKIPRVGGDVYNMVYSEGSDLLFTGCDKGLFAWRVELEKIEKGQSLDCIEFDFKLPAAEESGVVVDSVCLIRDNILAVKCALHGLVYLFNISTVMKDVVVEDPTDGHGIVELKSESLLELKWSDTDNFYMNMGADSTSCTLVCGDDKGALWVYDLSSYIKGDIESPLFGGSPIDPVECTLKLDWPELEDPEIEKKQKVRMDAYDIVVDKCNVSCGAQYILAVTSNNMVCIWKRGKEKDVEEEAGKKRKRNLE